MPTSYDIVILCPLIKNWLVTVQNYAKFFYNFTGSKFYIKGARSFCYDISLNPSIAKLLFYFLLSFVNMPKIGGNEEELTIFADDNT